MTPLLLLLTLQAVAAGVTTIRVDSTTSVAGTVATLGKAAAALAAALAAGASDVVVELSAGAHRVPAGGLRLGAEHTPSDAATRSVRWRCAGRGAACSVHGGAAVTGWTRCAPPKCRAAGPATYVAPVPAALKGKRLRHLYVNGARANRTRTAVSDLLGAPPHFGLFYSAGNKGYNMLNATPAQGDFSGWRNPADIELIYSSVGNDWSEARCAVGSLHGSGLEMQQPCFTNLYHRPWQPVKAKPPESIDNIRSELGKNRMQQTAGQFYYDLAAAEFLYIPHDGEDMSTASAVVAVEENLVTYSAAASHSWTGVTFEYATWLRPMQGDGYVEVQSGACAVCAQGPGNQTLRTPYKVPGCGGGDVYATTPAPVTVVGSKDIAFDSCVFQHLGGYASAARGGSQRVAWRHCTFRDISSGALMLGGLDTCDEKDVSKWDRDFIVSDSTIANIPVEYTGATAVFFGYVENSTLEHNLIANTSYSAMTIGWGWGRTACGRGNNHIIANKVMNPNRQRCCDGGEVYTLGPQPNSSVERNHLANRNGGAAKDYGHPNALYHDNGSGGFTDKLNVIDGAWAHSCGENSPVGCSCKFPDCATGNCSKSCPDASGAEQDCQIKFVDNWLYKSTFAQAEQCSAAGSIFNGTINVTSGPLPPAAQAVVDAAGPRARALKSDDGACKDATDCSLNGDCVRGVCACDAAWSAHPSCDVLAFDTARQVRDLGYRNASGFSSWGGNAILGEDGKHHLFVAQFANKCELGDWGSNSLIVRATSATGPAGPFAWAQDVMLPLAHNPTIRALPNGSGYVLYMIGDGTHAPSHPVKNCTTNASSSSSGNGDALISGGEIRASFAPTITGPWTKPQVVNFTDQSPMLQARDGTNPSPQIHADGRVTLAFQMQPADPKKHWELVGVATAPSWRGPFTLTSPNPVTPGSPLCLGGRDEDPFLWQSPRGYHIITHGMCPTAVLQVKPARLPPLPVPI